MHWRPALFVCALLSCESHSAIVSPRGVVAVTQVSCDFESDFCSLTNDLSADFEWKRDSGKTPTLDTGPSSDHTTGKGFYVYLESSAPQVPDDRCRLVTPPLEAGRYSIGFWYSAWGSDVGVLALLGRDPSNGGRERLLWLYKPELNGSKADGGWTEVALSDVDLPEASTQLVWEGIRGVGTFGDIGLDDVAVIRLGDALPLASGKPNGAYTLPYECTFDEPGGCGMTNSWQSTDGFAWSIVTGPAASVNTGPSADHTFRNESGHLMLLDVANRDQFEVAVESTPALYSTCGCVELSFWWHGFGAQLGSLTVTQEGFDDRPLFSTGSGDSYNRWRQANVTLHPPTDRAFSIMFRGEVGSGALGDYAVDDISVQECSICFVFTTQATAGNVGFTTDELTFGSWQTDPSEASDQSTLDPQLSVTITAPDASTQIYFADSTTQSEAIMASSTQHSLTASPGIPTTVAATAPSPASTQQPPTSATQQMPMTTYASTLTVMQTSPTSATQQMPTTKYVSTAAITRNPPTTSSQKVTSHTPATSTQQILSTAHASTAATTYDHPTTSGQQVLATTSASSSTTTQELVTSTKGPTGQFYCDFESPGGCQSLGGSSTGAAAWLQTKVSDRPSAPTAVTAGGGYPTTDHTFGDVNLGTYMAVYVANESSGSASLVSADVYNPGGCNRLELWLYASGADVGSLTVALSDLSSSAAGSAGKVRYLWLTSGQNLSSWTKVVSLFKAVGPFAVSFTAKGSSSSWTTFAIDDVRLSAISCSLVADVPVTGGSTSTGVDGYVYMTGTYGVVQSANFPSAYPAGYSQKWNITVASDSRVAFTLALLDTEACCDVLQVFDTPAAPGATAVQLMRASGVLTGEPQTYYSTGSTILASFTADWDVSLTGFRLQWWAVKQSTSPVTTTVPTTTQLSSFGQFACSFDVGWCGMSGDTLLDYGWMRTNPPASNYRSTGPSSDHTTGLGAYVYANSKSPGNSNVARLLTGSVYSADGCSVLAFYYHATGPSLGSLTVRLLGVDAASPNSTTSAASTVLWYTSGQVTNGWTQAVVPFRYSGAFRLTFEAKRINSSSLGDYTLDDIAVTTCAGLSGLTAVPTTNPYADNGNTTYVNGDYGTLRSPNYPRDYASSYQHTWKVSVSPSKRVAVFVNDFLTEACCDILRLIDGGTGRLLQTLQGVIAGPATYYSETNNLTVIFETDGTIQMRGWQLTWWAVAALDSLTATAAGSSASRTTADSSSVPTISADSMLATSTTTEEWQNSTGSVPDTTTTTYTATFEVPTTEINSSGSGASAQTGVISSTLGDWIYFVIAIALIGTGCTVILSICLWRKRQKNKVGTSMEGLRDGDQLEDGHTIDSSGERTNTRIVPDQEVRVGSEANKHSHSPFSVHTTAYSRPRPPTRWPYIARGNELYDRLDQEYEQIDNAQPSSNSDDWKLRNLVINPLHPRRQGFYLGEDGQPHTYASGGQKQHKKHRRHKHRNGSRLKPLAPLRSVFAKAASSLGSARSPGAWSMTSTSRVSPAVVPESTRSIISIPGGGVRPPRPEMVVLGGGRRQPDNPPTTSVA